MAVAMQTTALYYYLESQALRGKQDRGSVTPNFTTGMEVI